jgi:uncharacterized protein YejL (UPF0352 family)
MDSTRETVNKEFSSKVSQLLPNLGEVLEEHGVLESDKFEVNLGIDLSELQSSLASQSTMSCYWNSSKERFICSPTSPNEAQLNSAVESKLLEMLPDLGKVLEKHKVSKPFKVNLGIDLSEFASTDPDTISTMGCCTYPNGSHCSSIY